MENKTVIIFNPSIEGGGVEKNLFLTANYLSKNKLKVKLICSNKFNQKIDKKIEIVGNDLVKVNHRFIRYFIALVYLFFEIFKNKKMIVLSFQANLYATILCLLFNVPIIIRSNSSPTHWVNNKLKYLIYKTFYKYPKKIIVNSYLFKEIFFKKLKIKPTVIYNAIDPLQIKKNSQKKIKFNFFEKTNLKIISIGRLVDQKDHLTTLMALNLIKDKINFKYLIIGQGSNEEILREFIKKNNLSKKVKIMKYKQNPFPYLKKADTLILSSVYEGLPNVILEAMALKKFIISSDCPTGPSEILEKGKHGMLFNPKNYKDLSQKILLFGKNKKEYNKIAIKAFKTLSRFNQELILKKYLKLIKSI